MSIAVSIIASILGLILAALAIYWIYIMLSSFKTFKMISSVERRLAVMTTTEKPSTIVSSKESNKRSQRESEQSSKTAKKRPAKNNLKGSQENLKKRQKKEKKSKESSKSSKESQKKMPQKKKSKESSQNSSKKKSKGSPQKSQKSQNSSSRKGRLEASGETSKKALVPFMMKGPHLRVDRKPDNENFCEIMDKMAKFVKKYMKYPGEYPVTRDSLPGFLFQRLPTHPPAKGVKLDNVMDDFMTLILPCVTHYKHPRYLASNVLTRSIPDLIGELFAVHVGSPGFIYDACPAVAEMQVAMLNWAGRALGIPERFLFYANSETCQGGASFQESIGDSTLCALMVARTWATNQQYAAIGRTQRGENYLFAETTAKNLEEHHLLHARLCASSEAHPTVEKQCRVAMLRLRKVPALAEKGYGMTAKQVEKMIKEDVAMGLIPACIIVTLGTEGILANDELGKIGRLGFKYTCWIHVMAHSVSSFWTEPKFRPAASDLLMANSIMGILPYHANNMVVVWTKDQTIWKDGFRIFAQYLKPSKSYAIDERDWTIHLSRRFRGIKVWFNYRMIGLKKMREHANQVFHIELLSYFQICRLTAYLEEKLASHENIRMFGPRVLNSICFQYYEKGLAPQDVAKYTRLLGIYINESHRLFLKISNIGGSIVLSMSISFEATTRRILDELYKDLVELIHSFRQQRDDALLIKFPPELSAPPSEAAVSIHTAQKTTPPPQI